MNTEVERYEGELAKLRLLKERVMALPRCRVYWQHGEIVYEQEPNGNWIRAADIDAIAREVEASQPKICPPHTPGFEIDLIGTRGCLHCGVPLGKEVGSE